VELVFGSHAGQVWRAVLTMSAGRAEIADEATAEAFARLFAHRERVRDPVAWVFRTAFRIALAEIKRERRQTATPSGSAAPADRSLLSDEFTIALRRLTPEQRAAVFLFYFADLPMREIAHLSGAPVSTVKVRLHRARRSLRESLATVGADHG
jgi:RNA polymerase sigma-70 factor, ECF subfamily